MTRPLSLPLPDLRLGLMTHALMLFVILGYRLEYAFAGFGQAYFDMLGGIYALLLTLIFALFPYRVNAEARPIELPSATGIGMISLYLALSTFFYLDNTTFLIVMSLYGGAVLTATFFKMGINTILLLSTAAFSVPFLISLSTPLETGAMGADMLPVIKAAVQAMLAGHDP
ncbi:MAG: hypothetical protein R3360_02080, partial [Alphaproteobacteria bacterium]|nr:hypothetical protein [Alphaproteobacteria bacterium]